MQIKDVTCALRNLGIAGSKCDGPAAFPLNNQSANCGFASVQDTDAAPIADERMESESDADANDLIVAEANAGPMTSPPDGFRDELNSAWGCEHFCDV